MLTDYQTKIMKTMSFKMWKENLKLYVDHAYDLNLDNYTEYDYKECYNKGLKVSEVARMIAKDQFGNI